MAALTGVDLPMNHYMLISLLKCDENFYMISWEAEKCVVVKRKNGIWDTEGQVELPLIIPFTMDCKKLKTYILFS